MHFSGHGTSTGLAFETEVGVADQLGCEDLGKFLRSGSEMKVKLAFVSACHSQSIGETFNLAGVPHVVAVRWDHKVPDTTCQKFERAFYTVLLEGKTVQAVRVPSTAVGVPAPCSRYHCRFPQAFEVAERIAKVPKGDFCLLPIGGNHDVPIDTFDSDASFLDATPPRPINTCDSVPTYLIGRCVAHVPLSCAALRC